MNVGASDGSALRIKCIVFQALTARGKRLRNCYVHRLSLHWVVIDAPAEVMARWSDDSRHTYGRDEFAPAGSNGHDEHVAGVANCAVLKAELRSIVGRKILYR
jgi:hypothetical protein